MPSRIDMADSARIARPDQGAVGLGGGLPPNQRRGVPARQDGLRQGQGEEYPDHETGNGRNGKPEVLPRTFDEFGEGAGGLAQIGGVAFDLLGASRISELPARFICWAE